MSAKRIRGERQIAIRGLCRKNVVYYIENFCKITDLETARLVNFKLNNPQRRFVKEFIELVNRGGGVSMIVLKARKMGFSTLIEAILLWRASLWGYMDAFIIAHKPDSSQYIYEITRRMYDELPSYLKPKEKYSSKKELVFNDKAMGVFSKIKVAASTNMDFGRGFTPRLVHFSEFAYYQDPENILTAVDNALPLTGNTMKFIESTANGKNYFHHLWHNAPDYGYHTFFAPWYEYEKYRIPLPGDSYDEKIENYLRAIYPDKPDKEAYKAMMDRTLDGEQLLWRHRIIKEKCRGNIDIFHQEYPATPEEAFLASGDSVFDQKKIAYIKKNIKELCPGEVLRGTMASDGIFRPTSTGDWKIYRKPVQNINYAIGVDSADGTRKGSFSTAIVMSKTKPIEVVAVFRARCPIEVLADQVISAAIYYNNALVNPETNNMGQLLLKLLLDRYDNIYMRKKIDDSGYEKVKYEYGVYTTHKLKVRIIEGLAQDFKLGHILVYDQNVLNEMEHFMKETTDSNKLKYVSDTTTDLVMAMAFSWLALLDVNESQEPVQETVEEMQERLLELKKLLNVGANLSYATQSMILEEIGELLWKIRAAKSRSG